MTDSKKGEHFNGKWAIVTDHDRLPPIAEQIARARAWGVTESMMGRDDISALIRDDVRGERTTNYAKILVERAKFLAAMAKILPTGDRVWFCTPLCVGFSKIHALETINAVWGLGMSVYVHSVDGNGAAEYAHGVDLSTLLAMVEKQQNTTSVRKSRKKS